MDDIVRIPLDKPDGLPEPVGATNNVYLLHGDAPALINVGHPSQFQQLTGALREEGVVASQIERVIHTSWQIDMLGAASRLPDADHFVPSPDMVRPSNYEAYIDSQRAEIRALGKRLIEDLDREEFAADAIEEHVATYYPRMPRRMSFVPIRGGHVVCGGEARFEVVSAPGPDEGHVCLYDAERSLLFCGSFSLSGMPDFIDDVQDYLVSLERLMKIEAEVVHPNYGRSRKRSSWTLARAHRFLNNFLSNAPAAMHDAPTVVDFIETDRGYAIEDIVELIYALRRFKAPMDELVRSRMIDSEGEGLGRRYGTDIEDPRAKLRSD